MCSVTGIRVVVGVVCFLRGVLATVKHPLGKGFVLLLLSVCVGCCFMVLGSV